MDLNEIKDIIEADGGKFIIVENEGIGITLLGMNTIINNFSIMNCIGLNILNSVIFSILGIFFNNVYPNENSKL